MAKKQIEFVNPFTPGVSYAQFLESIPEGTSVAEYCKGKITEEQIEWLINDLKHYQK